MIRIAIPTDDGKTVASHFGQARYFLIVEFENGMEVSRKLVENLHALNHHGEHHGDHHGNHHGNHFGNHHGSHNEIFLSTGDIQKVIAVRVGPRMAEDLKERNIDLFIVPINSEINDVIKLYQENKLRNVFSKNK